MEEKSYECKIETPDEDVDNQEEGEEEEEEEEKYKEVVDASWCMWYYLMLAHHTTDTANVWMWCLASWHCQHLATMLGCVACVWLNTCPTMLNLHNDCTWWRHIMNCMVGAV